MYMHQQTIMDEEMTFRGRIAAMLMKRDLQPIEIVFGFCGEVLWGLFLVLPFRTFASSPSFAVMDYAPEWLWGLAVAAIGIARIIATGNDSRRGRNAVAVAGIFMWGAIASMLFWANPHATGWVTYGLLHAMLNFYLSLRHSLIGR